MKRLLSLLLSAVLLAGLPVMAAAPSAAKSGGDASADVRLARVTQAVKNTLALNTDAYDEFHGGVDQELVLVWSLDWQGDKCSLSVRALEDGTVISYSKWDYNPSANTYSITRLPVFPESARPDDRAVVQNFLDRVLRKGESAKASRSETDLTLDGSDDSWWYQKITLNGLPSPLTSSVCVENGEVTHFSRDLPETGFIGGVPSPDASADKAKAAGALRDTLKLRLEYVLDKPTDTRAVLRYVPERIHDFQVDARTGALLDVTELEQNLEKGFDAVAGGSNGAAPTAMAEDTADREAGTLTAVEEAGVAELEGVLSQEELDKALRTESAYGLAGYTLASAGYESGEDQVTCTLRYTRTEGGERLTRNITVDAKTGAVDNIWSSAPFDRAKKLTEEDALKKAEAFCKTWCPDRKLTLYQTDYELTPWRLKELPYWGFTFAQEAGGIPFRQNTVFVNIDASDGSVYYLSSRWDEDVTFDSASGIVSKETALAAWGETYSAALAYRGVPQKLVKADPIQAGLMEQGMTHYTALRLTYALEREGEFEGIDAKTGKPVRDTQTNTRDPLVYTDLAGNPEKADIEKLAKYGVGYDTETFRPGRTMTQWELVALVESLRGPAMDPETVAADQRDSAYAYAYRLGLLRLSERKDGAVLTRGQVVKMLLDAAGYGPAARLEGIYTSDLRDFENQSAGERGYAAIAQALGMVSGSYAGSRAVTRGEAASMLCRVLERKL